MGLKTKVLKKNGLANQRNDVLDYKDVHLFSFMHRLTVHNNISNVYSKLKRINKIDFMVKVDHLYSDHQRALQLCGEEQ